MVSDAIIHASGTRDRSENRTPHGRSIIRGGWERSIAHHYVDCVNGRFNRAEAAIEPTARAIKRENPQP